MNRDIIPAEELLYKAHAVGQYYGFVPLATLTSRARGRALKTQGPLDLTALALDPIAEVVTGFLRQCQSFERPPSPRQPLFVWHSNLAPGRAPQKKAIVQFHALGADRPLGDAVLIRAILALVRDLYHEEPIVRVNSMGDKETRARYARELANFFKKRAAVLPEDCISCAKRDTFEAAELVIARACADDLPSPTEHLSDASRKRFEDLLEYLEMTDTPYELSRHLMSRGNAWNDTCFEIVVGDRRVAWGSRYYEITKNFFPGTPFSGTAAVMQFATEGKILKKPPVNRIRFSFVHIGDEAKRLSIHLAEEFRRAKVPVAQTIGIESLTEQLLLAEQRATPYLIVMGRKEALENTAILRNRQTQEEMILPLEGLAERLKTVA